MDNAIEEILKTSGNNLHVNVVTLLKNKGWETQISPYYNDNQTNKARELDVIAEKEIQVTKYRQNNECGALNIKLFIECTWVTKEILFWFDTHDKESKNNAIEKNTREVLRRSNINIERHHHYTTEKIAKLFDGKEKTAHSGAINQVLNGTIYFRKGQSILKKSLGNTFLEIHYPIIVYQNFSKVYAINIGEKSYKNVCDPYFSLAVNYSYIDTAEMDNNEYFLVDIVDLTKLEEYLKMLEEKDFHAIKGILEDS